MLDCAQIEARLTRLAPHYAADAFMEATLRQRLLNYLPDREPRPDRTPTPYRILDAGAGTCALFPALEDRFPDLDYYALDRTLPLLTEGPEPHARYTRIQGDLTHIPLHSGHIETIVCSGVLQNVNTPEAVLRELLRVLRSQGTLMLATWGSHTLHELRESWETVDTTVHVHPFWTIQQLGTLLLEAGLHDPVLFQETIVVRYHDLGRLWQDLRASANTNQSTHRNKGLTSRARFAAFCAAYAARRDAEGRYPVTYEMLFAHARAPYRTLPVACATGL